MSGRPAISRDAYPQLADFAAGYLHQDYRSEHRTAAAARDAFLAAANAEERDRFAREIEQFLQAAAAVPWDEVRQAWAAFGAAWMPPDRRALVSLLAGASKAGGAQG
jgi:hypothetical protein